MRAKNKPSKVAAGSLEVASERDVHVQAFRDCDVGVAGRDVGLAQERLRPSTSSTFTPAFPSLPREAFHIAALVLFEDQTTLKSRAVRPSKEV